MNREDASITIVIPSRDRPESLRRTLASIAAGGLPDGYRGTLVVENGSSVSREVVAAFAPTLCVTYRHLETGNKSLALNRALEEIEAGLVVFFDDDVIVDKDTLAAYAAVVEIRERGYFFGGTHEPAWLGEPDLTYERFFMRDMVSTQENCEGPIEVDDPHFPFLGFNWAVWSEDLRRVGGFDPRFGPGSPLGATGQESEMQRRLVALGLRPFRLLRARVRHVVDASQTSASWLIARRRRHGVEAGLLLEPRVSSLVRPVGGHMIHLVRSLAEIVLHPTDRARRLSPIARVSYVSGLIRGWVARRREAV